MRTWRWAIVVCGLRWTSAFGDPGVEDPAEGEVALAEAERGPTGSLWPARLAQTGAGLLFEAGLALAGYAVGAAMCRPEDRPGFMACLMPPEAVVGIFVGGWIGSTLGVHLIGGAFQRRADAGATIVGGLVGTLAVIPMALWVPPDGPEASILGALAILLPTAGALIGFEISSALIARGEGAGTVSAAIVPIRGGALLSAAGRF